MSKRNRERIADAEVVRERSFADTPPTIEPLLSAEEREELGHLDYLQGRMQALLEKRPDRGRVVHGDRRRWAGPARSDREAGTIPGRDEPGEVARQESAGRGRSTGPTARRRSIRRNSKPWSCPSI